MLKLATYPLKRSLGRSLGGPLRGIWGQLGPPRRPRVKKGGDRTEKTRPFWSHFRTVGHLFGVLCLSVFLETFLIGFFVKCWCPKAFQMEAFGGSFGGLFRDSLKMWKSCSLQCGSLIFKVSGGSVWEVFWCLFERCFPRGFWRCLF